jgi:hypothetical protein
MKEKRFVLTYLVFMMQYLLCMSQSACTVDTCRSNTLYCGMAGALQRENTFDSTCHCCVNQRLTWQGGGVNEFGRYVSPFPVCSPCPDGSAQGSSCHRILNCNPINYNCPQGQFFDGNICERCYFPALSWTDGPGKLSLSDCKCAPGRGFASNACSYCAAGKYKSDYSLQQCQNCEQGKFSQQGSTICTDFTGGTWHGSPVIPEVTTFLSTCPPGMGAKPLISFSTCEAAIGDVSECNCNQYQVGLSEGVVQFGNGISYSNDLHCYISLQSTGIFTFSFDSFQTHLGSEDHMIIRRCSDWPTCHIYEEVLRHAGSSIPSPVSGKDRIQLEFSSGFNFNGQGVLGTWNLAPNPIDLKLCIDCLPGTFSTGGLSNIVCTKCSLGTYTPTARSTTCIVCPKFAGQFATVAIENVFNSRSTTNGTGTASEDGCICGRDSNGIQLVQVSLQASSLSPVGSNRVCLCNKGFVMSNTQLPTCTLSPANYYQPQVGGDSKSCPANSYSAAGSDSWDDCKCNAGFDPEAIFDDSVQTGFNCYCKPGYYVSGTVCVKCEICNPLTHPGQYKDGCGKASAGECKKCAECDNPLQKRAGCGFFSAGECKDKDELVRTPFCPVEVDADTALQELSISVRQASGLGAFSFEQVFGTDAQGS